MPMISNYFTVTGLAFLASLWVFYNGGNLGIIDGVPKVASFDDGGFLNLSTKRKQQQQGNEKPILTLIVGPPNTNTSSIQEFAANHEQELQQDNLFYVEEHSSDQLYQKCYLISEDEEEDCTRAWKEFGKTLEFHRERNHNILVSNEFLGAFYKVEDAQRHLWVHLLELVQDWDVRVVYSYRRFHEWVPNHYTQMTTKKIRDSNKWPDQGGQKVSSLKASFNQTIQRKNMHPQEILKQWKKRFSNVSVFNTHAPGNLIGNFFCRHVPEAARVCGILSPLNNETRVEHRNFTDDLQFDLLSVAAYEKGLVNASLSRRFVTEAAQHYGTLLRYKRKKDFPLHCLSQDEIDRMLNMTISIEQDILPDFYESEYGEAYLRLEFRQGFRKRLPCSLDVDIILNDPRWKDFFKNVGTQVLPEANELPIDYHDLDVNISFLGIGAQGAATTWLADMLRLCRPQVDFGIQKEIHFWDNHRFNGLKWYSDHFPNRHRKDMTNLLHGELTPHYLALPDEDIREIRLLFPDVRIFFVARNLIDRAWSHVRKNLRGDEKKGILTTTNTSQFNDYFFMKKLEDRDHEERSNYEVALRRWYKHFPDEQILILNFDDIEKDAVAFVFKVLNHLKVDTRRIDVPAIEKAASEYVNLGQESFLRPSLRKKLEEHYRLYAKAFNDLLEEKSYSWRLEEYTAGE